MSELRTECFFCKSKNNLIPFKEMLVCESCACEFITEDKAFNYVISSDERMRKFYKETLSSKGTLYEVLWSEEAMHRVEDFVRSDIRNYIKWLESDPFIVEIDEFRSLFPNRKEAIAWQRHQ